MVGDEAAERIGTVLYWYTVGLVVSVWIGFILVPELATEALLHTGAPIGWDLHGVFPSLSSNAVGALGVLVTFWSLARLRTHPLPHLSSACWRMP